MGYLTIILLGALYIWVRAFNKKAFKIRHLHDLQTKLAQTKINKIDATSN